MAGGILLTVAGIWVLAQVLRGDALGRLGIVESSSPPAAASVGGVGDGFIGHVGDKTLVGS